MTNSSSMSKTSEMTKIALLVAMNCVSAYIIIPLPFSMSPISLQTLIINLVGFLMTPKQAFLTMLVYILIGLAGISVFTGGTSGPGKLFGPTGGYFFGFLISVTLIAFLKGENYNFRHFAMLGICVGIPITYLAGVIQLKLVTGMAWTAAVMTGAVPFIPLDIVKCLAAAFLAGPICRIFGK